MSTKKRDLAQELVDFLLKEDAQKKTNPGTSESKTQDRTKPYLVPQVPKSASPSSPKNSEEQKTVALAKDDRTALADDRSNASDVFEFNAPIPSESQEQDKKSFKILESLDMASLKRDAPSTAPTSESKVHSQMSGAGFSSQRGSLVFNDVSSLLAGTEAVKVAQARIGALEKERDQVRTELENLIVSTETLQRRMNELKAQHETLERKHREKIEILEDEKAVLKTRLNAKEEELTKVKRENEDLSARFQNDVRKIRVRERELEHRQEILKAEMSTVVNGKDESIVELRRQLEKLHFEIDTFRAKSAEMSSKLNEYYDRNHRTVKALRLALSVLETGDSDDKSKKSDAKISDAKRSDE